MTMRRRQVGDTLEYAGRKIRALHLGPDLLCVVNDVELPNFYLNVEAAHRGGRSYVDDENEAAAARLAKESK